MNRYCRNQNWKSTSNRERNFKFGNQTQDGVLLWDYYPLIPHRPRVRDPNLGCANSANMSCLSLHNPSQLVLYDVQLDSTLLWQWDQNIPRAAAPQSSGGPFKWPIRQSRVWYVMCNLFQFSGSHGCRDQHRSWLWWDGEAYSDGRRLALSSSGDSATNEAPPAHHFGQPT